MDSSTNVREAAVDLIGKFIILKPALVDTYYDMLTARILVSLIIFCTIKTKVIFFNDVNLQKFCLWKFFLF